MDTAMQFELTMRLLFGEKAYHIAGSAGHPAHRREWLQRAVRRLLRLVNTLDTTPRHKQMLMVELEEISGLLKGANKPSWALVYHLLSLCMRLVGFDYTRGVKCHTPIYWRSHEQYYTAHILSGGDVMQDYNDKTDAISVRRSIVKDLKGKGLDDFKISLVLNTIEYEVNQLRSSPASNRPHRKRRAS